jgi:hypothetical protein
MTGAWWVAQWLPVQEGYVGGFLDCYTHTYKGRGGWRLPNVGIRDSVTRLLELRAVSPSARLAPVLLQLRSDTTTAARRGDYDYFDGDGWAEVDSSHQVGFIAGYVDCRRALVHDARRFSKPVADYQSQITRWYEFHPDVGNDIPPEKASVKIRVLLERFADSLPVKGADQP